MPNILADLPEKVHGGLQKALPCSLHGRITSSMGSNFTDYGGIQNPDRRSFFWAYFGYRFAEIHEHAGLLADKCCCGFLAKGRGGCTGTRSHR